MDITTSPRNLSPAYAEALFTLSASPSEVIDLEIIDYGNQTILGKKRFTGTNLYTVNVAGYAQRCLEVMPLRHATTAFLHPTKRMVNLQIKSGSKQKSVTLTSGIEWINYFSLLSKFSGGVEITPTQGDEISLYTDDTLLYADVVLKGMPRSLRLRLAQSDRQVGLTSLYLSMADIAQRTVQAGAASLMDYTEMELQVVTKFGELALSRRYLLREDHSRHIRLCWWNRYGQVDYYTLTRGGSGYFRVEKQQVYTSEGYKTIDSRAETLLELTSGYLNERTLDWLGEMVASPRVWIDDGTSFAPVEILSTEVVTSGEKLQRLHVTITPSQKHLYQNR